MLCFGVFLPSHGKTLSNSFSFFYRLSLLVKNGREKLLFEDFFISKK
jgi:hypothetical protein